jgi:hypothetical protein
MDNVGLLKTLTIRSGGLSADGTPLRSHVRQLRIMAMETPAGGSAAFRRRRLSWMLAALKFKPGKMFAGISLREGKAKSPREGRESGLDLSPKPEADLLHPLMRPAKERFSLNPHGLPMQMRCPASGSTSSPPARSTTVHYDR